MQLMHWGLPMAKIVSSKWILLRRNAAGELSELFGKGALELDKKMRFHQLRARSQEILKLLPEADQLLLATYTRKGLTKAEITRA